jgi:ATPase subunit of ABC transporter with duplicated ATPase domains
MVLDYELQQKEIQRIKLMIRRFRQWGLEGDNEDFFKRAKMWEKRLEKIEQLPKPKEYKHYPFLLNEAFRSGKNVLKLNDVSIGYNQPLLEHINLEVFRKERIAIQAPNGLGKTTLIKTILNEIPTLSGTIEIGTNVHFGYLPQLFHFEMNQTRLLAYVQYECEVNEERARQLLATFGFYQADVFKPLSFLSGGESVRVKLLVMMTRNFNCLILDEPTNHLDAESAEIIETTLKAYDGTLLIISHDRYFLNRINVINYNLMDETKTR